MKLPSMVNANVQVDIPGVRVADARYYVLVVTNSSMVSVEAAH